MSTTTALAGPWMPSNARSPQTATGGRSLNLDERIDAIEAGYEFMLAYAAQGRLTYSDASGSNLASCPGAGLRSPIRRYKADTALAALDASPTSTALPLFRPPLRSAGAFARQESLVDQQHEFSQPGSSETAPQAVVPFAEVAIVRADPYANGAIRVLAHPEAKALLGVRGPLEYALQIRNAVRFP